MVAEAQVAETTLYEQFRSKDEPIAQCLHRLDERYLRWFLMRSSAALIEVERRAD